MWKRKFSQDFVQKKPLTKQLRVFVVVVAQNPASVAGCGERVVHK